MTKKTATAELPQLMLTRLAEGLPSVTPEFGAALAQAAAVCLEQNKHALGVRRSVVGTFSAMFEVYWPSATDQARRCWNDPNVATEHAAYGVAFLLILDLTGYTVIERSRTGTGFDYWLGNGNDLFQKKARLEVSGILRGTQQIERRVRLKKQQTTRSEGRLPAFVIVVEFGAPTARVVKT
jgi:hypothetical protein